MAIPGKAPAAAIRSVGRGIVHAVTEEGAGSESVFVVGTLDDERSVRAMREKGRVDSSTPGWRRCGCSHARVVLAREALCALMSQAVRAIGGVYGH